MDIFDIIREQLYLEEKLKIIKKIKQLPEKVMNKAMRYILKQAPDQIKTMEKAIEKAGRKRR